MNSPRWIQAARDGDAASWARLHATYWQEVVQWCRRLGGPQGNDEDAAQEVFISLHLIFYRFDSRRGAFEAFLYGITRRVVSDHRRRAWIRRWTGSVDPRRRSHAPTPEGLSSRAETIEIIDTILEKMNPAYREVIVLGLIEERDSFEVAALTGINPATVRSRLRRAREQFRKEAIKRGLEIT